jgi:hypothetical protein
MRTRPLPAPLTAALAALALVATLAAPAATAAPLVGTDPAAANGGFGIGFSFDQQFSIGAAPATVGGISVWLNGLGSGTFTLQVMDAIGGTATASNVLLTLVGNLPNITGGHEELAFTGLNLALAASTDYFLVISSGAGPDTGWGTTTELLAGTPGTVGSSFVGIGFGGAVADYTLLDTNNPSELLTQFRIDPVAPTGGGSVPLPSTLALSALGLLGATTLRRRRLSPPRPTPV